jgi:hypothetical protein
MFTMKQMQRRRWLGMLCGLAALSSCGCSGGDADRLARVWHRVGARLLALTGGVRQRLTDGWTTIQTRSASPAALRERVSARLRMDKALASIPIEVDVEGGKVTLRGETPDAASRKRAVELAEGTLGVEQVLDELAAKE